MARKIVDVDSDLAQFKADLEARFDKIEGAIEALREEGQRRHEEAEKKHAEVMAILLSLSKGAPCPTQPPTAATMPTPPPVFTEPIATTAPASTPPSMISGQGANLVKPATRLQSSTAQPNPTPSPPINPPTQPTQSFVLPPQSPPPTFTPNQSFLVSYPPAIFGSDNGATQGQSSRLREDAWREDLAGQLRKTLYRPKDIPKTTTRQRLLHLGSRDYSRQVYQATP